MNAFDEYCVLAFAYQMDNPAQRHGQAHFNALRALHPEIADAVQADFRVDPFDDDDRMPAFLAFVRTHLEVSA